MTAPLRPTRRTTRANRWATVARLIAYRLLWSAVHIATLLLALVALFHLMGR